MATWYTGTILALATGPRAEMEAVNALFKRYKATA